jgi:hypothetical protein
MAFYRAGLYNRRRSRNRRWIYVISALVVITIAVVLIISRHPSSKDSGETEQAKAETAGPPVTEPVLPQPKLPEVVQIEVSEPNVQTTGLIDQAMACLSAKPARIIEARDRLNELLPMPMNGQQLAFVKAKLSELAEQWLFSRAVLENDKLCGHYKVKPGEQFRTIGIQCKVPFEILMEINNIARPEALQAGEIIKIIYGPFHARVYLSTYTMDLYLQNTFVRSFPVGLARADRETPTGVWLVKPDGKLISPTWTDPDTGKTYQAQDTDYPLGSRWIGLEGIKGDAVGRTGFAIHGTKDPNQIGSATSRGCIRLHNGDAKLIYNLLMPGLSQVEVVK